MNHYVPISYNKARLTVHHGRRSRLSILTVFGMDGQPVRSWVGKEAMAMSERVKCPVERLSVWSKRKV